MTYLLWIVCAFHVVCLWQAAYKTAGYKEWINATAVLVYGGCAVVSGLAAWNWGSW